MQITHHTTSGKIGRTQWLEQHDVSIEEGDLITGPAGPQGPQGEQGLKGDTGLQGPKGDTGQTGTAGYTPVKGVDYFDGATGPAGPKGDTGSTGSNGAQGPQGPQGDTGSQGTQGIQGIQGIQGPAGPSVWGGITGTMSSQSDLATALAAKQATGQTVLSNDTLAQALATNINTKLTVTAGRTLTTTVPPAGTRCSVMILTSGTVSYTITFGTGFKPTGTLATGTTNARVFVVNFISDGTNLYEAGRTAAMVA